MWDQGALNLLCPLAAVLLDSSVLGFSGQHAAQKKDTARTCQACKRWVLQRGSSVFDSTLQFSCPVTDLGNAGEEWFDLNVGVDDFELMIPETSRDSQSPQQASLAPKKAKSL